jgi:hypothetical protein
MRRAVAISLLYAVVCLSNGCNPPPSGTPAIPVPGALAPAGTAPSENPQGVGGLKKVEPAPVIAAKKRDEYWTKEEVEIWVRQDLKLAQVTLTPQAEHGFTGTGLGFNGRNYTLTVKQIPGGIKCSFSDDFGGSGNMAFGKMAEEPKQFQPVEPPRSGR